MSDELMVPRYCDSPPPHSSLTDIGAMLASVDVPSRLGAAACLLTVEGWSSRVMQCFLTTLKSGDPLDRRAAYLTMLNIVHSLNLINSGESKLALNDPQLYSQLLNEKHPRLVESSFFLAWLLHDTAKRDGQWPSMPSGVSDAIQTYITHFERTHRVRIPMLTYYWPADEQGRSGGVAQTLL